MTACRGIPNQMNRFQACRSADSVRTVWVRHIQTRHDPAFESFHLLRLCVGLVIVAVEVQKPMHRKVGEVMKKVAVLISAFPFECLKGDYDIAEQVRAFAGGEA